MHFRSVFFASIGICGSALFFACGDNSFEGTAVDGGADASADGSTGSTGSNDGGDASTQGEDGSTCPKIGVVPRGPGFVDCPKQPGAVGGLCSTASNPTCCLNDGSGTCNPGDSCSGDQLEFACEKGSDCAGGVCCLAADAGPPTACIDTAVLIGSSCTSVCNSSYFMCTSDGECTGGTTRCKPIYLRYAPDNDAGVVVGVCVP
jgi:hypothetical protein